MPPMSTPPPSLPSDDPVMARLEDQINWYDSRSMRNQSAFKRIKISEIVVAAFIPVISISPVSHGKLVTAGLGVLITILEGLLHLNQYQQNWITYRSTCESLKHEKYIFLGQAPPYANAPDARALLAERVESLVSQEHAKWASTQQQESKPNTP